MVVGLVLAVTWGVAVPHARHVAASHADRWVPVSATVFAATSAAGASVTYAAPDGSRRAVPLQLPSLHADGDHVLIWTTHDGLNILASPPSRALDVAPYLFWSALLGLAAGLLLAKLMMVALGLYRPGAGNKS
jgi:hypothetical protein